MNMPKISVVGAGNVGATAAFEMARRGLGDVVLLDIIEGVPQGKALDIQHAMPLLGSNSRVTGTNDFSGMEDSAVVVVAAGVARKPGMSREDLLGINTGIVRSVCGHVKRHAPGSVVIMVTNPIDITCWIAYQSLGFPRERVLGMAGVLDSARFRTLVSLELGIPFAETGALVMGSHGDTMVPVIEHSTAAGWPLAKRLSQENLDRAVERTREAGSEIVSLLKSGSAFYAPAVAVAEMAEAITGDTGKTLPVSALLQGEYGLEGLFFGVPAKLGRGGIREIVELDLEPDTLRGMQESAKRIKFMLGRL
jgi:malate dehydrogenase